MAPVVEVAVSVDCDPRCARATAVRLIPTANATVMVIHLRAVPASAALAKSRNFVVRPLIIGPPFARPIGSDADADDDAKDLLRSPYERVTTKSNDLPDALSSCRTRRSHAGF